MNIMRKQMAFPSTEMEVFTIVFSLVVFGLFTARGMFKEKCAHIKGRLPRRRNPRLMEVPFTNLELAFILIAFMVFSMFSLVSVLSNRDDRSQDESSSEEYARLRSTSKRKQSAKAKAANVKGAV